MISFKKLIALIVFIALIYGGYIFIGGAVGSAGKENVKSYLNRNAAYMEQIEELQKH